MNNSQGEALLKMLFNEGEEVYASPDKYSSKWNEEEQKWDIYRPSVKINNVDMDKTVLIGINPIKGMKRSDSNVTAYRSFLVEMDGMTLKQQQDYIKKSGLPYSACIFSGNKSLHFAVTLNQDLPNAEYYKYIANWLLTSLPEADQSTKNPSRGIRFPGVRRPGGKNQTLIEIGERVSLDKLKHFLSKHPNARPKDEEIFVASNNDISYNSDSVKALSTWVLIGLKNGFDFGIGRNNRWFSVAVEFGKSGFGLEKTIAYLHPYFIPESTFSTSEWTVAIKSGWKKGNGLRR